MNLSSFGRKLIAAANGTVAGTLMGLGTAAFKNTGTSGNTVPLLDGTNTASGVWTFSANPSVTGGAISFPATQVASAGANDLDDYEEGSWTPTITATSGTFTTVSATGSYTKVGRAVVIRVSITITTVGTASGGVVFTLPFTANSTGGWVCAGRENNSTGKMLQALIAGSATTATAFNYDNTSTIGAGFALIISGTYWI